MLNTGAVHPSNRQHVPSYPFQPSSVYPFTNRTRAMPRCGGNGINSTETSRPAGAGTPPLGAETTSMYAHTCGCITAWHICVCEETNASLSRAISSQEQFKPDERAFINLLLQKDSRCRVRLDLLAKAARGRLYVCWLRGTHMSFHQSK